MWRQQRTVRVVVWGAAAVFLIGLGARDLQLDRTLELAVTRFDRATPYLSTLGPPSRVVLSSDRAELRSEPVYMNLRIPRWFRDATIEIDYENPHALPLRVGVRTHPTQWAFHFSDPLPLKLPLPAGGGERENRENGVGVLRVPFQLQRTWQVERNVYRFVLSVPGASVETPLVVHALRVTAEREPVCIGQFCV